MRLTKGGLAIMAVVVAGWASAAEARARIFFPDWMLVEKSELIVVAAIKDGSITESAHYQADSMSSEVTALLTVHEMVKGESKEKEIMVVLGNDLRVTIDGKESGVSREQPLVHMPAAAKAITLTDIDRFGSPIVEDARQQRLWFLKKNREGIYEIDSGQMIAPLNERKYIECYLAKDPEKAVRAIIQAQPEYASRVMGFLQSREIKRILQEKDPAVRVERLMPYYRLGLAWNSEPEARDGIIAAGAVAGPYLLGLYKNLRRDESPNDIFIVWAEIGYRPAVPTLIEVLEQQENMWGALMEHERWGEKKLSPEEETIRSDSMNRIASVANALRLLPDARAKAMLLTTKRRWESMGERGKWVVEQCDEAIKAVVNVK